MTNKTLSNRQSDKNKPPSPVTCTICPPIRFKSDMSDGSETSKPNRCKLNPTKDLKTIRKIIPKVAKISSPIRSNKIDKTFPTEYKTADGNRRINRRKELFMTQLGVGNVGILERAQMIQRTLGGFPVNNGQVSKMLTMAEQEAKANNENTPLKIRLLLFDPYNQMSVITEHLGLTGIGGLVSERMRVFNHPIRCLVNVTYEAPLFMIDQIETIRIPVSDDSQEEISIYFDEVGAKLEENRLSNHVSIVHCMAGVSRSASFVIAYLMRYNGKNLEEAFRYVRRHRQVITPNVGFLEQLSHYERRLYPESRCSRWCDHIENGITIHLPEFIVNDYLDDYAVNVLNSSIEQGKITKQNF